MSVAVTKWVVFAIVAAALLPAGRELLDEMARDLSGAARTLRSKEEAKASSNQRSADFDKKYVALKKNSR
jgi:Sec-independent protein translocase protein TatA